MTKIKLKISQLVMVLQTEKPKYPIILNMSRVSKKDLEELLRLLKEKKG